MGCQLTRIVLAPHEGIRGSGVDLKSYYSQCIDDHPKSLSLNAFGRPFDGAEFQAFGGSAGSQYYLALAVWGMGNINM
eukprot:11970072-Karenia_brevis.AAC.1